MLMAGLGCSGNDPCAGSPCPNDTHPTPAQYQDCVQQHQANQGHACNAQSVAYELCGQANTVCNSNGTTDVSQTATNVNNNCSQAFKATVCCAFPLGC